MRTRTGIVVGRGRIVCDEAEVEPLRDGDLLVRTEFASICGSDLHVVYDGVFADPTLLAAGFPGHEGIGRVVESRHGGFVEGQRVLCLPGGFGELRCFSEYQRVRGAQAIAVGDGKPVAELLMAQQLGTVMFALGQHPAVLQDRVAVVLGQGSAGLFWSYLLKAAGARTVIAVDPVQHRLAAAVGFGADVTLCPGSDDVAAAVADLTGGRGADYVVDAVGNADALTQSIALAGVGATLFWFGLPDRTTPIPVDFSGFFMRKLTAHTVYGAQDEPGLTSFHRAIGLIERSEIDVRPLLSHVLPIERIDDAFELARHPEQDAAMKVSLRF